MIWIGLMAAFFSTLNWSEFIPNVLIDLCIGGGVGWWLNRSQRVAEDRRELFETKAAWDDFRAEAEIILRSTQIDPKEWVGADFETAFRDGNAELRALIATRAVRLPVWSKVIRGDSELDAFEQLANDDRRVRECLKSWEVSCRSAFARLYPDARGDASPVLWYVQGAVLGLSIAETGKALGLSKPLRIRGNGRSVLNADDVVTSVLDDEVFAKKVAKVRPALAAFVVHYARLRSMVEAE
ncbi:MAG TPA: hypothetical protein VHZ81_12970 [Galbitalea sp.]|jgi:hypothetical protein|nr:hypothetical protein [Galbitalea sp.]